jgi:hypothetical protein
MGGEDDRALGQAALEALGRLHPADLAVRVKRALAAEAPPQVRLAAQRALGMTSVCK